MKLYVAYGSNLHKEQMKERCPGAIPYHTGTLQGWELVYRGVDPDKVYATIQKREGAFVPVAVWEITEDHERSLDEYEVYPTLYFKEDIEVTLDNGESLTAMVYIMTESAMPGIPSDVYVQTIREGYADFGLDLSVFENSLKNGCF